MKGKNDRTYSLTAKERKQLRNPARTQPEEQTVTPPQEVLVSEEQAMLDAQKRSKRMVIILTVVIVVAVLSILAGILIPVIAFVVNPYLDRDEVIARFNLSNGMVLEYVIEENEYDIAATNFIFLAKNGYFDNTVFFDATNGWLRFGGYEEQPSMALGSSTRYDTTRHHAQNVDFCTAFTAIPNDKMPLDNTTGERKVTDKFGYKLYSDSNGDIEKNVEKFNERLLGTLTYLYSDTNTEFQFAYSNQPIPDIERADGNGKVNIYQLESTMVGYAYNQETIDNIVAISATAKKRTAETQYGYIWAPPSPAIYIETVKVYNLNKEKWDDFDFIEYMNDQDSGVRRLSGWTGVV